jgi:hypothetical protein
VGQRHKPDKKSAVSDPLELAKHATIGRGKGRHGKASWRKDPQPIKAVVGLEMAAKERKRVCTDALVQVAGQLVFVGLHLSTCCCLESLWVWLQA